jgi:hypothetical protein
LSSGAKSVGRENVEGFSETPVIATRHGVTSNIEEIKKSGKKTYSKLYR